MPRISEITDDRDDPTLKPVFDKPARAVRRPVESDEDPGALPADPARRRRDGPGDRAVRPAAHGHAAADLHARGYHQRLSLLNGHQCRACRGKRLRAAWTSSASCSTWRDSKLFSEAERVALEYAEAITYTDRQVDDALFAKVKQHFTEPQIVELTAAIAFENFRSKFNPTLGVEAQGFCMVPKR